MINIDGHNFDEIAAAFKEAKEVKENRQRSSRRRQRKRCFFHENEASWHGAAPNEEQYAVAMADLEKVGEALCQM